MRKKNIIIFISIIVAILLLFIFYTPKYQGKEIKNNELCVLAEKDKKIYVICNNNQVWESKYKKEEFGWQKFYDKIDISEFNYLGGEEIKNKNLDNLFIYEGGISFHEPLKMLIKDKNRFGISIGAGSGLDQGFGDNITLRIYNNFREYTYRYKLKDDEIEPVDSFYYRIIY